MDVFRDVLHSEVLERRKVRFLMSHADLRRRMYTRYYLRAGPKSENQSADVLK
jgi:hypothetical protein